MKRHAMWITMTVFGLATACATQAATITAFDLDYGISAVQSNVFDLDFSGEAVWTAGSQRSDNGDPNNPAGRVFIDFQLDAAMIAAANAPGALAYLTFSVNSIGVGNGPSYTDGLDLRYLGVSAADRTANAFWNTAGVGGDQADLLPTSGPTGSKTVLITNASVLSQIQTASVGQFVGLGLLNSVGTLSPAATPVGNSTAQTYGFQMSLSASNYVLTIVPEPSSLVTLLLGSISVVLARRKRSR